MLAYVVGRELGAEDPEIRAAGVEGKLHRLAANGNRGEVLGLVLLGQGSNLAVIVVGILIVGGWVRGGLSTNRLRSASRYSLAGGEASGHGSRDSRGA